MLRALAIGLLLTLLLGAAVLVFGPASSTPPTAPVAPPIEPFQTPRRADAAHARSNRPLPPQHGPLRERVVELQALAEAGHGSAACRLVLELSVCRSSATRARLSGLIEGVAGRYDLGGHDEAVIGTIAAAREAEAANAEHCAGLVGIDEIDAVALLQRAALRGNTRLRVIAALTQPDGHLLRLPRGGSNVLPIDNWVSTMASQFYADHALQFLREGYLAHDPLALEGLILIHAPDSLQLPIGTDVAFRLPDPRRFAGYALLAERVYGGEMLGSQVRNLLQRVLERMEPAERRRLDGDVEREAARWLADRERPPALPEGTEADAVAVICP